MLGTLEGEGQRRMKVYLLDAFRPAGVAFIARHADIVRSDDPRATILGRAATSVSIVLRDVGSFDKRTGARAPQDDAIHRVSNNRVMLRSERSERLEE